MNRNVSRRRFLTDVSRATVASAFAAPFLSSFVYGSSATPNFEVSEIRTLTPNNCYYGWPTVAIRGDELLVVTSGGREGHVCPFGRVDLIRSRDFGATWTWPQTIYDGPIDDRDAGVCVTDKGTILATTFTSLAYVGALNEETSYRERGEKRLNIWSDERYERWLAAHNRIGEEERKKELGCWMLRSTDDGITWSERYATPFNSPHGPNRLSDGRLLYMGKELWTEEQRCGAAVSEDDGQTWTVKGFVTPRDGDSIVQYHELHAVEANGGRIVAQIRNENPNNANENLQTISTDGGETWSVPRTIGVWGIPSFLSKLQDGRLLMTYGHRRAPLGVQARVSDDDGDTWSEPLVVYGDAKSGDLGYPSTVQLPDGSLITVWYEVQEGWFAKLRFARWKLNS